MAKTPSDAHIDPDLRQDVCDGAEHVRLLIQVDRKLGAILELLQQAMQR